MPPTKTDWGIGEEKAELRRAMRKKLKDIPSEDIEIQSRQVAKKIIELPAYRQAGCISLFLSMPSRELATRSLVLRALDDGKKVFVPYIYKRGDTQLRDMEMLQLHSKEDLDSLKPDAWGIPTLGEESIAQRSNALGGSGVPETDSGPPVLDIIFLPALAFDPQLRRLGHGKGFYDRYLTRYKKTVSSADGRSKMPKLIGLALKQQMLPDGTAVPTDNDDWRIDQIVVGED